jgi:hypothetical protein
VSDLITTSAPCFWFLTSFSENLRSCRVGIPHEEAEVRDVVGKIFHSYLGFRSCKADSSDKAAMHCGFDVAKDGSTRTRTPEPFMFAASCSAVKGFLR